MNKVLESIKPVIERSRYVKINEENIRKVCKEFNLNDVRYWMDACPFDLSNLNDQNKLDFIFVFDSMNFCYWGDPKWTIEYQGKPYDGAYGMIAALGKAVDSGIPILEAEYLANTAKEGLMEVLRGNVIIPLFEERLRILREIGLC